MIKRSYDDKPPTGFCLVWILFALLGLGIWGLLIWAVVRVVLHFT